MRALRRGAGRIAAWAAGAVMSAVPAPAAGSITLGPGPALGTDRAGVTWYEEFQDWGAADVRAIDEVQGADFLYAHGDGLDDSRDLVAFYTRDEGGNFYFRVDLFDLALGAEVSGLDIGVAVDVAPGGQVWLPDFLDVQTDRPWELCLIVDQTGTTYGSSYRMFDAAFTDLTTGYLGSYFRADLDAVEFGITRQTLLDQGWDGVTPPVFQVFTAKDGAETGCTGGGQSSDLTDAITDDDRGCGDGILNGGVAGDAVAGTVIYCSIAHGNQSVNRASDISDHIYDPESNTGISGGTGFQRTLDSHAIFGVPLNIHPSGTLLIACRWARTAGGAADPADGPSFVQRIAGFVDADQSVDPGSLIGGVLAEHILPYFEGPVNAASLAATDSLLQSIFGLGAADLDVMHTPERVIRSQSTGLSPLDGHTFEDIAASPYRATYLDEVTHLHHWFYPGESCFPDAAYRHKVHLINGVYTFLINEREDGAKFGNDDGGMVRDTRASLAAKALAGDQIVVVFDDWEALAGKSFNPIAGVSVPNNNPNQYHATLRWAANHPWIRISNLKDALAEALADPGTWVIDHGMRFDLPLETYEWLKHATEDSYHNWYYNLAGGVPGNEQGFYDLVPVITGPQGDYFVRGATTGDDGPPIPSGMTHGDLNTPGTLLYESWAALDGAPAGAMRDLGIWGYLCMIYETAWHEENEADYSDSDCYQNWLFPDGSWDGLNTWALRLQNHVRQSGIWAAAAHWAEDVRTAAQGGATQAVAADLDLDGEDEYVIRNDRVWMAFERYGGRCVAAAAFDPATDDAVGIIGSPLTNPSAPGEEEGTGPGSTRSSAFKEMTGAVYVDDVYAAVPVAGGWRFTSGDGLVEKTITVPDGSSTVSAAYDESVGGPLYIRMGLSPNPLDLAFHGHANLAGTYDAGANTYELINSAGGGARLALGAATFNATPLDAGPERRDIALTEDVELFADGVFTFTLDLAPGAATGVPDAAPSGVPGGPAGLVLSPPRPSPGPGAVQLEVSLPAAQAVRVEVLDVTGRVVQRRTLGLRPSGLSTFTVEPRDDAGRPLAAGVYWVRVRAGAEQASRKWVRLR